MEAKNITERLESKNPHKNKVHKVLAHSYFFYFISFLLGLLLDFVFPFKVFDETIMILTGLVFLIFGTFLIFWAQMSSHKLEKKNMNKETFCRGPYCYTRSPTHLGLFLLMLGFGLMTNSFFIVVLSILSFFIPKITFIKKEEEILTQKYGAPYTEYKKSVKL